MCGIAGFVSHSKALEAQHILLRSNSLLAHRGPDDSGHVFRGPAGLAMSRLSIVDVDGGGQPITNARGDLSIVFNGEIYNFAELKASHKLPGYSFKTRTDTEVILALYERYGPDCLQLLRGMFAFAIWDHSKQILFIARDRIGKKPIFYAPTPSGFFFASELEALSVWPWIDRSIDLAALDSYLALQYVPSPLSIYRGIRKLPPAHFLVYKVGTPVITRYWDLRVGQPAAANPAEATELIRSKVREAVRIRMMGDVPVGAFLSGGVDSSVIVACMSELSERTIKTFSIGFEDQAFNELPYAREVANHFQTDHHEFVVKPDLVEVLPRLIRHYGEPFGDSSALPSFFLAQEAVAHVKVALNGDGGDELFAGYYRHPALLWANRIAPPSLGAPLASRVALAFTRSIPGATALKVRRALETLSEVSVDARILRMNSAFSEAFKARSYLANFKRALVDERATHGEAFPDAFISAAWRRSEGFDPLNRLLYVDLTCGLPDDLLVKIDIATMANSLEGRSPLLDHQLVECAFSLPGAWKLGNQWEKKRLLKDAFRSILPRAVLYRPKMGFGIPAALWLRGPLRTLLRERVYEGGNLSSSLFTKDALEEMWTDHQSGREDHSPRLWALLMLELWKDHARPDLSPLSH